MTGHGHHHGDPGPSFGRLLTPADLGAEFGASALSDPEASSLALDAAYAHVLSQQTRIVEHQWRHGIERGMVRGFCLSGPPGIGKTTMAKALGHELGLRFAPEAERDSAGPAEPAQPVGGDRGDSGRPGGAGGSGEVVTVVIDGGDVARAKYGESEQRIRDIFRRADVGFDTRRQRSVLVFDDVESIFMNRGSAHAKEWHFSQDSVFFHCIDEMDTSRTAVVLTTNRPDLVDDAIRDRFLEYRIDYPSAELLVAAARRRAQDQHYSEADLSDLTGTLRAEIAAGRVRSIRDAQHAALTHYVSSVLESA